MQEELPPVPPVQPLDAWFATRDPALLTAAVESLEPKLANHLHRYGLGTDPLAKGKAKVLAARALKTYNPEAGAGFNTWLDRQMQPLTRFRRLRATAIKIPEKIQLTNMTIDRATAEFQNEHGRDPELEELADASGLSVARINKVRGSYRKMTGESSFENSLAGEFEPDHLTEAMNIVWDESDALDRKILEMKTGYGGKPQVASAADIAVRLKMTPVQLSRRSTRLAAKLDELLEELEK